MALTIQDLKEIPAGKIFLTGIDTDGIVQRGITVRWIAKKGMGWDDWAIYWLEINAEMQKKHIQHIDVEFQDEIIAGYGHKLRQIPQIRKLVPCDIEVLEKYRW